MKPGHCVIIVENLPVPLDRHVWQQALTLKDAGWNVTVICPATPLWPNRRERLEGIDIYRHRLPVEGNSLPGHIAEYAAAFFQEAALLIKIAMTKGIDVIHVCNPPDFLFLLALPFKLRGVRLIFDHHDLAPELYESIKGRGPIYWILLLLERMSFKAANVVLSSNQAFKDLAIERGRVEEQRAFIVHTVPALNHIWRTEPDQTARAGASLVIGYLGIIGRQDGIDDLLYATRKILDAPDPPPSLRLVIIGDGPALPAIRKLTTSLSLDDVVVFRGYLTGENLAAQMSDFDIGVIPDPKTVFNDLLTMNKVFEYSALGLPIVSYRLKGTVSMLGNAAVYAPTHDHNGLAIALSTLINEPDLRKHYANAAMNLAEHKFRWENEASSLLQAYASLPERKRTIAKLAK